jgi:uncharacterized NAD(P)/FAD-binding protein YdhS
MPEIAIVGSGFGMLAVLDSLVSHQVSGLSIAIYSKDHDEIGDAYKRGPDVFIMNTKTSALKPFDHILPLGDWLRSRLTLPAGSSGYIPRWVFGEYLSEVAQFLISRLLDLGNTLHRRGEVDHIAPGSQIVLRDGSNHPASLIFLSMGFGASIDLASVYRILEAAPANGAVDIVGSGLSGIDMILLAASVRPDLAIRCHSRSGRFPRIRSDFETDGASILGDGKRAKPWTLIGVARAFQAACNDRDDEDFFEGKLSHREELAFVRSNVSGWQRALYNSTRDYADAFQQFNVREKRQAFDERPEFLQRRVMYPVTSALRLDQLLESGQLSMHRQAIAEEDAAHTRIYAYNRSKALYNFVVKSGLAIDEYGCALSLPDGCICNSRLIYALGPMTNGVRYFTEASSLTQAHARLAVRSAIAHLQTRQSPVAEWASL